MINYRPSWLDSDLEMYRDTVCRFIDKEMAPLDEEARERGNVGHELWLKAGAVGLLRSDIPREYGGGGGDFRHEAIFYDAMARRGLTGMKPSVHTIVAHYLLNHGTEEQKREYLPRLASGELVGAIAMTEPGAGSGLQSIRTRAEKRAGCYVINGSKTFISSGVLAGLVLVVAKISPAERANGMSIILVETAKALGFRVGRVLDKIGLKAQDTCELFFDEVLLPAANLLGGVEGRGFYQLMSDLPYERTIFGVMAAAAMEGALEATLAFVRERKAFGKSIAEFQNTKYRLAELATITKVTRSFVDQCVEALVSGTLDAATASMAKLWASEQQGKVIDECLQLHGGSGFMNEYLIARMYADARMQRIYGGTSEMMKEVISRAL